MKKFFLITCLASFLFSFNAGAELFNLSKGQDTRTELLSLITWQEMPNLIKEIKKNKKLDLKKYPFLYEKGFRVAGLDYENCVYFGKGGLIADNLFYCEKEPNFKERASVKLVEKLADNWYWAKYYM